jgi:hypothetical protein
MARSLARLLNDAPEFNDSRSQEPLQPSDPRPLSPESPREFVELTQTAAVDACQVALTAMLARVREGDRHGS